MGKDAFPGTGVTRDQELEALKRERVNRVRYPHPRAGPC